MKVWKTNKIQRNDTNQVKIRTDMWLSKPREVIGYPENDRRLYTFAEKEFLFKQANGICQICENKINDIDNANVDHIEFINRKGNL